MNGKKLTQTEIRAIDYYVKNKDKAKVTYDIFMYRVNRGYTLKESLFTQGRIDTVIKKRMPKKARKKAVKNKGIKTHPEYQHYKNLAISNGIKEDTFYQRIVKGKKTMKEAATTPLKGMRIPEVYIKLAEKNGINRRLFRQRIVDDGWTIEEAATIPVLRRNRSFNAYDSSEIKKIENNLERDKVLKQIEFYQSKGLVVPKKYLEYAKKHNLIIT